MCIVTVIFQCAEPEWVRGLRSCLKRSLYARWGVETPAQAGESRSKPG